MLQRASSKAGGGAKPLLIVSSLSMGRSQGFVMLGQRTFKAARGRAGVRAIKREGDGATPLGVWPVRNVLFRPDRLRRPQVLLPMTALSSTDGWCDAAQDRNYNRRVQHPYAQSAERLWREDGLYDVVLVLGYNDRPRIKGRGSAIFMHVARATSDGPGLAGTFAGTQGCVAVSLKDLLLIGRVLKPATRIWVRR